MPEEMSVAQRREFLAAGIRTATIVTLRADGRPHAVPIWFVVDGDDVVVTTREATVKGRNMIRDPRVSVVVDDEAPPCAFVSIDGRAEVSRDGAELRRFAAEIGRRYLGEDGVEQFVDYAVTSGMSVFRVRPERVTALDKIGG